MERCRCRVSWMCCTGKATEAMNREERQTGKHNQEQPLSILPPTHTKSTSSKHH